MVVCCRVCDVRCLLYVDCYSLCAVSLFVACRMLFGASCFDVRCVLFVVCCFLLVLCCVSLCVVRVMLFDVWCLSFIVLWCCVVCCLLCVACRVWSGVCC